MLCLVEASGWTFFAVGLGVFHNRKGLVRILEILMDDVLRRLAPAEGTRSSWFFSS